jgi:hypothetical protein
VAHYGAEVTTLRAARREFARRHSPWMILGAIALPNDLHMLLLGPKELAQLLLLAVPATVAAGALLVGLVAGAVPIGALVSAALAGYVAIGAYEWTHFLIHTAHRPRSPYYRGCGETTGCITSRTSATGTGSPTTSATGSSAPTPTTTTCGALPPRALSSRNRINTSIPGRCGGVPCRDIPPFISCS